jgi:hypothetical protein
MGQTIWIADAHCGDGKRFVVHADEKLTAFLELEATILAAWKYEIPNELYRSGSGSQCKPNLPEPRLKFVLMLMGRNLKNSFVFATLAFLTACQTPQASNQQDRPARTGQSSSPSSQYEVEPISGIQRPFGAPGTFQPGSGRGP